MKKIKLVLGATSIIMLLAFSYKYIQVDIEEKIIGTWYMIDPNDINQEIILPTKWVFTSGNNCIWYENNISIREFNYNITNYSCSDEYDSVYKYLKLENSLDFNEVLCYAINGISEEDDKMYLSIEFDGSPRPRVFVKDLLNKYDLYEKYIHVNEFDVLEEFNEEDMSFMIGDPDSVVRSDYDKYYYGNSYISVGDFFITYIYIIDTSLSINNIKVGDDISKVKNEFLKHNLNSDRIIIYQGDNTLVFYYNTSNKVTKITYNKA